MYKRYDVWVVYKDTVRKCQSHLPLSSIRADRGLVFHFQKESLRLWKGKDIFKTKPEAMGELLNRQLKLNASS